jgi:hypothetical protein
MRIFASMLPVGLAVHANPLAKPANNNFLKSFGINLRVGRHLLLGRRNMLSV